jgi:hypothetical protein
MSAVAIYGRDALRRLRERQAAPAAEPKPQPSLLEQVPPDAPMDEGITLGCWNGKRFVSWERWCAAEARK